MSLNIAFTINVVAVSMANDADTPWGVEDWALWMNSIVVGSIAMSLLVTLIFLLVTIKTYIKGAQKTALARIRIKQFFVFFTLVYIYIAILQFWGLT